MQYEEQLISMVKKQKDCEFTIGFLVKKDVNGYQNFFTLITLTKKGANKQIINDYGDFILGIKSMPVEEGLCLISNMYLKEAAFLEIPGICRFTVPCQSDIQCLPSKSHYGYVKSDFPMLYTQLRAKEVFQNWGYPLLKSGLPYYPDLKQAVINFLGLPVDDFSGVGEIDIVIIDYRAKIETVKLVFSKVEVKLSIPEIRKDNVSLLGFAKAVKKTITLPETIPKEERVTFDIGFQPESLDIILLSHEDNTILDSKNFSKWWNDESIIIERPEEEIVMLMKLGESENLEYKFDCKDEEKKNDLSETVVAFLNTHGGTILIGVDDSGNLVGCHANKDDIFKSLHDRCDPPPRGIKIEEEEIDGKKIITIDVPEGGDKPYQSKKDRIFYVRHGSSDMRMERSELVNLIQARGGNLPPF